jgi:putative transposase
VAHWDVGNAIRVKGRQALQRLAGGAARHERNHRIRASQNIGAPEVRENHTSMPSTHLSLHYHLVFSTKNREAWFTLEHRERVHRYLGGIIRGMNGVAHAVGGTEDHVHIFAGLRATHCLADVMREVKADSSAWIHREIGLAGFHWQEGYGAFTISAGHIEKVREYVLHQEEHHQGTTFQEEYVRLLKKGLVEYDDQYLW